MGFTSAWSISSHPDSVIAEFAPLLAPALEADRTDPAALRRWTLWQRTPLPDHRTWYADRAHTGAIDSFRDLTRPGEHVDDVCNGITDPGFHVMEDLWEPEPDPAHMFVSVHAKDYAVAALFHAMGPHRAARLPGWCGNALLTAAEVRRTLPHVERALTFTAEERARARDRDWLDYGPREERVTDGPLRVWRAAAAAGRGLCAVSLHVY
ncbi:hypothetical protein ADK52_04795 [Streptomyces sp. WM6372]|uniref:hypothetical protein n=1 Tax=Streptomyces sp. WM6372 TaxID=1415555 RepID=UPI0006AFB90B|nr:hypothetical protein [Streptomyces sp. WM6372]KOU30177.1 hypothetical protein ADK52_04795 [Streptomyces sp. WM6372]